MWIVALAAHLRFDLALGACGTPLLVRHPHFPEYLYRGPA
jgi:hypothetical protein